MLKVQGNHNTPMVANSCQSVESDFQQSCCETIKTLRSIWLLSPSCRLGFHHSRQIGPRASFRYIGRMILTCVIWSRRCFIRRERHKSVLSFMHTDSTTNNLLFDALLYKANKEMCIHPEIRRILSLPPTDKTSKDIDLVLIALREIPSFAEYPTPMQRQMCQMGWYQRVESKRVIIKEGQEACNFYFILSGTVVITEWNDVIKTSQTKCVLQRGMNFGEKAVLKGAYRSATVVSHATTELLCLDAHDLASMYICGREAPIKDERILNFLRSCYFLKDFPLEHIQTQPHILLFHYFQRGQVLVRDSHCSDWLYIVKSGSLTVLKKLHPCKRGPISGGKGLLPKLFGGRPMVVTNHSYRESVQKLSVRRYCAADVDINFKPKVTCRNTGAAINSQAMTSTNRLPPLVENRLSIGARFDAAWHGSTSTDERDAVSKPTFIAVCKLEKGQSFGLAAELFTHQPSLSVVSNGADCLLLSKGFFFQHCSDRVLSRLRQQELPYPTDEELKRELQAYLHWLKFKDKYYKDTIRRKIKI